MINSARYLKKWSVQHPVLVPLFRERLDLFGSGARGEMGPDSDIDILVINNGEFDGGALTEEIYMQMIGIGHAVDIVVVSATDAKRYRDSPYFII
ncbi:MAG: nucleotidyltransferase domain-containing protein, partial [Methanomicrobiales archaeon]